MNNDAIKETISNLKSVRNNFWTAILVTAGGSVTIGLNADSLIEFLIVIGGLILAVTFIALYRSINSDINSHIRDLEIETR